MLNWLYVILVVLLMTVRVANPTDGDKIGQISKIQIEGLLCKTTGILVTGKYGGGELKLTIPSYDHALLEKVRHLNDTQEFVKISYHTDFIRTACSNSSHNTFLDSVESHPQGAPGS